MSRGHLWMCRRSLSSGTLAICRPDFMFNADRDPDGRHVEGQDLDAHREA
jgi:hypothetical protein